VRVDVFETEREFDEEAEADFEEVSEIDALSEGVVLFERVAE
jgi:hypothetical protein